MKTASQKQLETKMEQAVDFNYKYYQEHGEFPPTSKDPYYRSAIRFFNGAENYRKQTLIRNGVSEDKVDEVLYGIKNKIMSKTELFNQALETFKKDGTLEYGSELVNHHYGTVFYIRMDVLKEMGYSVEDSLYEIKSQQLKEAIPLEEVLRPLIDYINETGEVPRSYEFEERGNIVRRFDKWEIAIDVAVEHIADPSVSIDDLFKKHRKKYIPKAETLEDIKWFIKTHNKLPKSSDIKNYRQVIRGFILWDNALDNALADLGYTREQREDFFRKR
ncbi:hypothetical protein COF68_05300 [Bacillus toyonensis]|uniref:hypothetical protein n=1 Tax=Bacillus toyonensis TaxID=155322 RepID=UPI000BFE30F6|nr:hypothetical protein [Bacillus toyonensis]PHE64259.1 hypothetical protein COF68_05300 [Bacillus toyonensis]